MVQQLRQQVKHDTTKSLLVLSDFMQSPSHQDLYEFEIGLLRSKDGKELMSDDSFDRWFNFAVCGTSLICLEKKDLPEHLQKIDGLDSIASLQSVLADLEDCGEAIGFATVHHLGGMNSQHYLIEYYQGDICSEHRCQCLQFIRV